MPVFRTPSTRPVCRTYIARKLARLWDLLCAADDETLLMARVNCHGKGISSIVLKNNGGRLLRAFMTWPKHDLLRTGSLLTVRNNKSSWQWAADLPVGVHDHRYSIRLEAVHGKLLHTCYRRGADRFGGLPVTEWLYTSGEMQRPPTVHQIGPATISPFDWHILDETAEPLDLDASNLHMLNTDEAYTAWFVEEGVVTKRTTSLFTVADEIDTSNLYRNLNTPSQTIIHVANWIECAGFRSPVLPEGHRYADTLAKTTSTYRNMVPEPLGVCEQWIAEQNDDYKEMVDAVPGRGLHPTAEEIAKITEQQVKNHGPPEHTFRTPNEYEQWLAEQTDE